jgi:TonB family protein
MPIGGIAPPKGGVTALPFEAIKLKGSGGTTPPIPPAPPKSKVGLYVGIGVAAALIFAVIAVVVEARLAKIEANDRAEQEALQRQIKDKQLADAEKKMREDAEESDREKAAEVAAATKAAEEETRRKVLAEVEAARLAKLPGILAIDTVPSGASVSVDGAAPIKTPVKLDGLAPGTHRVHISLEAYDPVDLSAEIQGSKTTDLGVLTLAHLFGSLDLSSSPDGLAYAIHPANDPSGKPIRTGTTPATLDDIPHGSYVVTFSRPGCKDHPEGVTVDRGTKSQVTTKYLDGSLELTSDPSGAQVYKDGEFLGTTPLTLHNLTPRTANFDLTLPGYDSTPIACAIPEGDTLRFSAQLLRKDRVFNPGEAKTPPQAISAPAPSLSAAQRKMGAEVLLSFIVRRDGSVSDVQVLRSTDDDIARRCKQAVEKWTYNPATASDDRMVASRVELPFKFPAQ